jgi:serine protease Do
MNNPGSPGGALTDRDGNLLGVIGRELRNTQTETTLNYAIPITAKVDVQVLVKGKDKEEEKTITLSLPEFVDKGMKGEYQVAKRERPPPGEGGWTGIIFVPNILDRTPAYVEDVIPDSPAAKAGLRPDDLISFVDGEPVISIDALREYLKVRTRPGTKIRLEVRRGETLETVEMTLGLRPTRPGVSPTPAPMPKMP